MSKDLVEKLLNGEEVPYGFGVTTEQALQIKEHFGDNVIMLDETMSKEDIEQAINKFNNLYN